MFSAWFVVPLAFVLDYLAGDPHFLPHPVRWMGNAIAFFERPFRRLPFSLKVSGLFFALFLIGTTWMLTFSLLAAAGLISPLLETLLEVILLYYCISARCLDQAAREVMEALKGGDLSKARKSVSMIVGRETEKLSQAGVARAAVETVAENLVDGFVSPMFFAMIGGVPLAVAYKMVNTLDSMVGYKNERYLDFGMASARIDDLFNLLPARISLLVISLGAFLISGQGMAAFQTGLRDCRKHSSPNAGFSEAVFAGALGVRLGGPNYYHGTLVEKPYIGAGHREIGPGDIGKSCELMMFSAFLWMMVVWGVAWWLMMI